MERSEVLSTGQAVEYHGQNGPNGLYIVEGSVEVQGEVRYAIRSVVAHIRGGRLRKGPRYRHNGGQAQPIRLSMVGRGSLCRIVGMTEATIVEVAI